MSRSPAGPRDQQGDHGHARPVVAETRRVLDGEHVQPSDTRPRAGVATITAALTLGVRSRRVSRISPARPPPSERTATPRWPTSIARSTTAALAPIVSATPRTGARTGITGT